MRTLHSILVCLEMLVACFIVEYPSVAAASSGSSGQQLVSDKCASCICHQSTGCTTENECVLKRRYDSCGYLQITKPYWIDAGYPVVDGDDEYDDKAFDRCAMSYKCSVRALRAYMERYKKDCNGDGKIDCDDFAAIHMDGPWGCTGTRGQEFAKRVAKCLKRQERSRYEAETNDRQSNYGYGNQRDRQSSDAVNEGHDDRFEHESGHW